MIENRHYIKFMSDIIDSGIWGELSPSARTLYPVLLKFSNQNFKPVWPNTDTLMRLTGFKTKKSIIQAKKDLMEAGLLHCIPGTGRTSSQYFFSFNYKGSRITPQEGINGYPWGDESYPSGVEDDKREGSRREHPNHINITITNNQNIKQPTENETPHFTSDVNPTFESLLDDYGTEIFSYAYGAAKKKGLEGNINYIRGICKNKIQEVMLNNEQEQAKKNSSSPRPYSWKDFMDWASSHLTAKSLDVLNELEIEVDGQALLVKSDPGEFLKNVILKFFKEEVSPPILVVFSPNARENRVAVI